MAYPGPGEVWYIDIEETRGHEQSGKRPAVVLAGTLGLYTVIPFTTSQRADRFPYTLPVFPDGKNGLTGISYALCFQVLTLDKERFNGRCGVLSRSDLDCIKDLLKHMLNL